MSEYLTKEQVNKKYKGKRIEFRQTYDYSTHQWLYEVLRVHRQDRENTTFGEDVGTEWEYRR
jgi:hypothetical protein